MRILQRPDRETGAPVLELAVVQDAQAHADQIVLTGVTTDWPARVVPESLVHAVRCGYDDPLSTDEKGGANGNQALVQLQEQRQDSLTERVIPRRQLPRYFGTLPSIVEIDRDVHAVTSAAPLSSTVGEKIWNSEFRDREIGLPRTFTSNLSVLSPYFS